MTEVHLKNMDPIRAKIKMNIGDVLKNLPPILDDFEFYGPYQIKPEEFNLGSFELENCEENDDYEQLKLKDESDADLPSAESGDSITEAILEESVEQEVANLLPDQNFSPIFQKKNNNNTLTQCGISNCNEQFENFEEYLRHFNFEHKYVPCLKRNCHVNMTQRYMAEHLESSHPNLFVECEYCQKWVYKRNATRHQKTCTAKDKNIDDVEVHSCPHENCNKTFLFRYYLVKHLRRVHSESTTCPIPDCHKTIKIALIKEHMKNDHGADQLKRCNICGKHLSRKSIYRHYRNCIGSLTKPNLNLQHPNDN